MSVEQRPEARALPRLRPRLTRYITHRPTPHQLAFLLLECKEAFYGGAAGGGKSDALLMAALQFVDLPGYAGLLVRETYQQLAQPGGLMARAAQWLTATDAIWNASEHAWRFPSGATLTFRHVAETGAERNFQGAEYQFIGVDEVTDLTEEEYRFLFSRLRRLSVSTVPLRMRAASNPYGPGLEWCHRRFILEAHERGRAFIPAHLEDNPYLDPSYEDSLRELGPIVFQQLRYGDWTIRPEGGLFKPEWFDGSLIDPRELPERLELCRFWDLASTEAVRGRDPDHTAGVLLGRSREGIWYVLDVARTRASPLEVERLVSRVAERDRDWAKERHLDAVRIRMEQEPGSSGKTLIDHYRRTVLPSFAFKGVRTTGSKETRAAPVAARAEAGDIRICRGRWNTAFLDELTSFPFGTHDDQVDALSGAYEILAKRESDAFPIPRGEWRPSPWRI